jgi:hypothetical protein
VYGEAVVGMVFCYRCGIQSSTATCRISHHYLENACLRKILYILFQLRPALSTETHTLFGYGGVVYKVSYHLTGDISELHTVEGR